MLRFFRKNFNETITINISANNISLAHFWSKKNNNLYLLNNYERVNINDYFIHNLNIYNFDKFIKLIKTFIENSNLINPFVYISFDDINITEQLVESNIHHENLYDQSYIINSKSMLIAKKQFLYISKIKHAAIFQYKLLAIQSNINLSKIIPRSITTLQILNLFKPDILKNINEIDDIEFNFENFIDSCNIKSYIIVPNLTLNLDHEKRYLMKNLGIFLLKDLFS